MRRLVALALLLAALLVSACRETGSGLIVGNGVVYRSAGECSSWFIQADTGRHYELRDLAKEFQQNQLRVRFSLKVRTDAVSVCMRGDIVDVVSIRKL
jgi:hypothetical protein